MARADDRPGDEGDVDPATAFGVVASETRLDILEALWRADATPVAFSTLFDAVSLTDSGQFNYHLQQLTGQFVADVEGGYRLRHAGAQVIRALRAGTFTHRPDVDPFAVDGACTRCGGSLLARYADEQFAIDCADCGKAHGEYPFPPGGLVDRSEAEIATAFAERVRHLHCLAADGVCSECAGRVRTVISRDGDCCLDVSVRAEFVCERCRHELCSPVGLSLLDDSTVAAFYADHGVDLAARPYWTLPWCVDDEYTTVESTDPWRVRVRIPVADEALHVTLDGDLQVVETARRQC
ncbi:helix-turn-helix domain-containing protein [Halomicroarcula sp. F13]|uniref:Helix-turn-helix domain-containing protein n=1 Tax=Haloarcula rubra TaxID=2487747 RepID=A0AAW4PNI4_9EURY|nr:helix-turn-helix domain-containing protein [Halomicroarcula rubra]MBX0322654.1 helix-turn-helix domain-containing protein [Halomicroarcula rubra]